MGLLYKRIVETGTLDEPTGVPMPHFALPSTINWMKALRVLIDAEQLNFLNASKFYLATQPRQFLKPQEENSVLEQMFLSLHQLSALNAFRGIACKSDISRMGIVAWYYGIYYAASAMICAQEGKIQDTHASTAKAWDQQLTKNENIVFPFNLRVSSLIEAVSKAEVITLRNGSPFLLTSKPTTREEANGAICAYLSGTCNFLRDKASEEIKTSKEFRGLGVSDFRTKAARTLRDDRLKGKACGFLHQAFRYRGKANYREALFLGYGNQTETLLNDYVDDLYQVLAAFVSMAGAFAAKRLGKKLWNEFLDDIETNRSFSLNYDAVWAKLP